MDLTEGGQQREAGSGKGEEKKGLQRINREQREENNCCKSMSGLHAPFSQPCLCIVEVPVRQQRRRLVIVFSGYRRAWQIKAPSGRVPERDSAV